MTAQLYNLNDYRRARVLDALVPASALQLVHNRKVPPNPAHMARAQARCQAVGWLRFVGNASAYELLQYAYAQAAEECPSVREADERDEHVALARLFAAEAGRAFILPRDMELVDNQVG